MSSAILCRLENCRECLQGVDAVEKVGLPGGVMLFGSFDPAETSRLLGFAAA
jgi:hypothetical protein